MVVLDGTGKTGVAVVTAFFGVEVTLADRLDSNVGFGGSIGSSRTHVSMDYENRCGEADRREDH